MIISCIGDSLTEGDYGIPGKTGIANVRSENYPYFLAGLSGWEVRNFGKCGVRVSGWLKMYNEGMFDLSGSDIILIMLGSNGGNSADEDTYENSCYEQLLDKLSTDIPNAQIYIITPPDATVNPSYSNCGYMPQVLQAQRFARKLANARNLPLIDVARSGFFRPELEWVLQPNDGLHLGYMGYALLADFIWLQLITLRPAPLSTKKTAFSGVQMVAHRGLSSIECENTAAAFIAAGNRSYFGIETDIRRTCDGRYVCSHDGRTSRVCEDNLEIATSSLAQLRQLRYNDVDKKTPCPELVVPGLEDYLRICRKYGKHSVLELKDGLTPRDIPEIIRIAEENGHIEDIIFISFHMTLLDVVRTIRPTQPCQLLTMGGASVQDNEKILDELARRRMDIDMVYYMVDRVFVSACHARGIKVNVWTVDCPQLAEYLADCGVDMITSNALEQC